MTGLVLDWAGFGLVMCTIAGVLIGRLTRRHGSGLLAIAYTLIGLSDVLSANTAGVVVDAALAAYWANDWWRNGGGGGTRRRLRSFLRSFRGVRRTAPVTT